MVLRRAACQCLLEFELSYPGLLSRKAGHLFALAQAEMGHVFQDYAALLAVVLQHAVRLLSSPSAPTSPASPSSPLDRTGLPPLTLDDILSTTRERLQV